MSSKSIGLSVSDSPEKKRAAFLQSLASSIDDVQTANANPYVNYLGLKVKPGHNFNIVAMVNAGFPVAAGTKLAHHLGLEPKALFINYLGMSLSTVRRREKQSRSRLNPVESDKLLRYARLLGQATRLMESDEEAAREWLDSPSDALGGQKPLECATTEVGARRVEDLLTSLEYGMFN